MRFISLRSLLVIVLILLLAGLNILKYGEQQDEVVSVWSSYDENYYEENNEKGIFSEITPNRIIYHLTKIRIKAPITYLKREIPLLGYYVPEDLRKPVQIVYQPEEEKNQVIKLKFDLTKKEGESLLSESKATTNNRESQQKKEELKREERPSVFIYHTHTSETYIDDPRPQDNNGHVMPGNIGMIGTIGKELASVLSSKYGFKVTHTTKVHDTSYARSYFNSRNTVKDFLNKSPEVDLILDIHRDGIKKVTENDITTVVNGMRVAKIMIVVTNGSYNFAHLNLTNHHTKWKSNLNFAKKLAAKMEELYPGLLQRLEIRDTTYNQDLHPRAILLEIGDYQNSSQEAIRSVYLLADVIAELLKSKQ